MTGSSPSSRGRAFRRSAAGSSQRSPQRVPALASAGVGAAFFALYLALLPRGYGDGDASELTLVLALGGVAHPPGYPLYVLVGHAWVQRLHACGVGWATAANAFSALGAGVALGLLHALAARLAPAATALSGR